MDHDLTASALLDGRYRVDRKIGEGGFGAVYAGRHLHLGVPVAIKVLRLGEEASATRRAERLAAFLDEGRVLTRLRHPGIVRALDLGLYEAPDGAEMPYLVMEWVDGITLQAHLATRLRAFSVEEARALLEPLLEALAHAHDNQVVHRDLKPSNVMVVTGADGVLSPRVIDFGVAKLRTGEQVAGDGMTGTAIPFAFTPAYAAPEQVTQSRSGPWTDVHAVGLLFTELLTGMPPYGGQDNVRLAVVDPERPTPRAFGVDVGPLEAALAKALALRPADRFADAGAMLRALRGETSLVSSPAPPTPRLTSDVLVPPSPAGPSPGSATEPDSRRGSRLGAQPLVPRVTHLAGQPGDTGAPSARTVRRAAPPTRLGLRRSVGVGLAVLGVVGATALVLGPRWRPRHVTASVPSAQPVRTLATFDAPWIAAQVERAGGVVSGKQDGPGMHTVTWMRGGEVWAAMVLTLGLANDVPRDEARMRAVASFLHGYRRPELRVAYGADDDMVAMVWVSSAVTDPAPSFTDLFADVPLLVRGTTQGPDDPASRYEVVAAAAPFTARRVGELGIEELANRLRRVGAEVGNVTGGPVASAYFTRHSAQGTLLFYRASGPAVRKALRDQEITLVSAADGDALVVVEGDAAFTTQKFLAQVLDGLGARCEEQRP